jgi:hypothetical protein
VVGCTSNSSIERLCLLNHFIWIQAFPESTKCFFCKVGSLCTLNIHYFVAQTFDALKQSWLSWMKIMNLLQACQSQNKQKAIQETIFGPNRCCLFYRFGKKIWSQFFLNSLFSTSLHQLLVLAQEKRWINGQQHLINLI